MPIETTCPGCGARLRLPDDASGRQAQCPKCQTTFMAGGAPAAAQPFSAGPTSADGWSVKMADGQSYGPVSKAQLDTWVREGRVTGDCQLSREGQAGWLWARDVYPVLAGLGGAVPQPFSGPGGAAPTIGPNSTSNPSGSSNPYYSPTASSPSYLAGGGYLKPHRGGLILALGILGIVICHFLGIFAWVMGSGDLKEMRAGRMDPAGQGLTQAGMIVGIIATVLMVLSFVAVVCFIGLAGGRGFH